MAKLTREFFNRNPERVAPKLLGKTLVRLYEGERLAGVIDCVRAFAVPNDLGKRYENIPHQPGLINMWGPQRGYFLLNITTSHSKNLARGIHIVTVEPIQGIQEMLEITGKEDTKHLTDGPGKLTRAFCLDDTFDRHSVYGNDLYIDNRETRQGKIRARKLRGGVFTAEYQLR